MSSVHYPVEYPDADGQPMAESDFQRHYLIYAVESLRIHFGSRPDVYVSGNLFIYYEQGNPKAVVAPDVFVVFGAPAYDRPSYRLWQEPKGPDFVLEITSRSTYSEDQGTKRGLYALLGVREYWQFDPTSDYLDPPVQGLQLIERNYWPLPARSDPTGERFWHSQVLGLDLRLVDGELRFFDPDTRQPLRNHREAEVARKRAEQALQAAEARAAEEAAQRLELAQRLAELEARLRDRDA